MSTAIGFRYLYNTDYIDREMDSWFHVSVIHSFRHSEMLTVCLGAK
jgi:hypothetical protein